MLMFERNSARLVGSSPGKYRRIPIRWDGNWTLGL